MISIMKPNKRGRLVNTSLVGSEVRLRKETFVTRTSQSKSALIFLGEPIPSGAESTAVIFHSPGTSIRRAIKWPMVEMVLPLMLESTFKGSS